MKKERESNSLFFILDVITSNKKKVLDKFFKVCYNELRIKKGRRKMRINYAKVYRATLLLSEENKEHLQATIKLIEEIQKTKGGEILENEVSDLIEYYLSDRPRLFTTVLDTLHYILNSNGETVEEVIERKEE